MKRILLLIFVLAILCLIVVYAFIPAHIPISNTAHANTIQKNIADCLRDHNSWKKWWPSAGSEASTHFDYQNYNYKLIQPFTNGAEIQLNKGEKNFRSRIFVIPHGKDSTWVEWQTAVVSGYNPFQRVASWFDAKNIKNNIQPVLESLVNFASNTANIYGYPVVRTTFTDTILAATRFSTNTYPTTELIYHAIDQLKARIKDEGAQEKDFPMLNVQQTDSNRFETMIAICVSREIRKTGNIFVSRMVPMKDRFLRTEVTGGPASIRNAHKAVTNYMEDRFLSAPAIPFEILVTDRRREGDTSKWKTIIFHPSM
jgi:effector-binding domain-containing protein